jgi:hypothetical protein
MGQKPRPFIKLSAPSLVLLTSLLLTSALLMTSCGGAGSGSSQPTTPAPEALFTAAARTAEVMRQQRFGTPATPNPQSLIETAAAPSITPTLQPTITGLGITTPTLPAATTAAAPPPAASPTGTDQAEYVADVTVPDGTVFAPGESFEKVWRILNSGQTTWTTDYELVFIDGDLLGAPASVPMPVEVKPGEKVDIHIQMTAPEAPGDYASYWELRNAQGKIFGLGPTASEAIWVKISVQGGVALHTEVPSVTPGGAITKVVLAVDNDIVVGTCPHTYVFTARISLSRATAVTYALEAGDTGGEEIKVPLPVTRNLEAGDHLAVYEITIPRDVSAWARLRVTEPVELISNQVNFSLSCTGSL